MQMKFQIGKNGISEGTLLSLKNAFKKHKIVRVSILRGAVRDKTRVKEMAEELMVKLGEGYKYRVIGFVIVILKRSGKKVL
jgi:RNA-binding protein YhbY